MLYEPASTIPPVDHQRLCVQRVRPAVLAQVDAVAHHAAAVFYVAGERKGAVAGTKRVGDDEHAHA